MDRRIYLTMPVYWTNVKKTKPSTTHLVGMNWFRNAHHFSQNKVKQLFSDIAKSQFPTDISKISKYEIEYVYYYKSSVSDLMNVVSLTSKIVNDALQEAGIVLNDTVLNCLKETAVVGGLDKLNPRVEIIVTPIA